MELALVTNNDLFPGDMQALEGCEVIFCRDLPEVLRTCKHLLETGWRFECDPLAGYLSRPNPFHSILLNKRKQEDEQFLLRDIDALDALFRLYAENQDRYLAHASTQRRLNDHRAVDYSIISRVLEARYVKEV